MPELLQLNPTPDENLLSLRSSYDPSTVSESTAESRAIKANLGAAELSPGKEVIKTGILNGTEGMIRRGLATQASQRDYQQNLLTAQELARTSGGPVTDSETTQFQQLITPPVHNPDTYFEKSYGDQMVGQLAHVDSGGSNTLKEGYAQNPTEVLKAMKFTSDHIANREYATTQLENYSDALAKDPLRNAPLAPEAVSPNGQPWGPSAADIDIIAQLIPLKGTVEWNVIAKKYFDDIGLGIKGDVKSTIVSHMYALGPDQFKQKFDEVFNGLKGYDPLVAKEFAESLVKMSSSDKVWDNLISGLDISTLAAPAVVKGIGALRGVFKATSEVPPRVENILSEAGNVVEAGTIAASKTLRDPAREANNMKGLEDILPSLAKPEGIMDNIGTQKREVMQRIVDMANRDKGELNQIVQQMANVERLTPEARQAGETMMYTRLQTEYPRMVDAPYDFTIIPLKDAFSNAYLFETRIGYTGGMPFKGKNNGADAAETAAQWMGLKPGEYEIKPEGLSSYISVVKPLRETDTAVRAGLIETTNNQQPYNWLSRYIYGANRADYNFSKFQQQNRLLATYAPSEMRKVIYDMGAPIRDISRPERRDLSAVWEHNSSMNDPETGLRGYFYRTPAEIESGFRELNLGAPTEGQISAYFSYTRMYDVDLYLRNLALTSAKSRLGIERVRFNLKGESRGVRDRTDYIDGRIETTFPTSPEDTAVLYITKDQKRGQGTLLNMNDIRGDTAGRLGRLAKAGVEKGELKLVQLHSPRSAPLSDALGENQLVHFVITDAHETAPLNYNHLPNRPGGHIINEFPVYLKQANFSKSSINDTFRLNYLGDKTIVGMDNAAQAAKFGPRFQEAIRLQRLGDEAKLQEYVNSQLPIPYEQFKGWFNKRHENGKEIPPFLDSNEDIYIVHSGKSVLDTNSKIKDRPGFTNAADSGYDLSRNINVGFTGERSDELYHIKEKSTVLNDLSDGVKRAFGLGVHEPAYDWLPSKVVDPIPSLGRALGQAINSRWLNDYQNTAVESWLAQHGDVLKTSSNKLKQNPYFYFHNPEWKTGLTGEATDQLAMAKTSRYQIRQFLGYRSELGRSFDAAAQRLVDGIYNKLGPRTAELTMDALPYMKNTDQYIRTIAFKSTLGFWNVPQFFVQMNTFAHTAAVAGASNAFPAVPAAYYSSILRYTREGAIFDGVDAKLVNMTKNLSSKYQWKPGQFRESHDLLLETGFQNVGGEVAQLDRQVDPTIYKSTLGKVIDSGDFFFKEGERSARLAAWHSAYREFRQKNPSVAITEADRASILQRADDLNVNMSRASNSALNSGLLSTTTQFYSYTHSMASQIWGSKLTRAEKFRTLAVQSALYGVPMGLSTTGLPVYEAIRSAAINNGHGEAINTDPYVSTMMNGFVQAGIQWATGTNPNIGGKFGNQGMSPLRDALGGDKEWWQILTGVAGSTVGNIIAATDPVAHWAMNMFREDNQQFPWRWEDVAQGLREVSSANIALRGAYAFNTGVWASKKNIPITREDPNASIIMSAFGLQPQAVTDAFLMNASSKKQKEAWQSEKAHIIDEIRRGSQAYANDDPDTGKAYMTRAQARFITGGFTYDQIAQIYVEANKGYMTMMDKVATKFPKMGATPEQRAARQDNLAKQFKRQYPTTSGQFQPPKYPTTQ